MSKKREKRGELERVDIQNFKGEIAHIKTNQEGEYRRKAARKKVGKKKKGFQVGKTYESSEATQKKWASKKKALESGKVHPASRSKKAVAARSRD